MSAIALAPSTITKAANALLVTTQAAAPISTLVAKMSVLGALSTMGTYMLSDFFAAVMRKRRITRKIQNFFDRTGFYPFDYIIDAILSLAYSLTDSRDVKQVKKRRKKYEGNDDIRQEYYDDQEHQDIKKKNNIYYVDKRKEENILPYYQNGLPEYGYDDDYGEKKGKKSKDEWPNYGRRDYDYSRKDYPFRDHPYRNYADMADGSSVNNEVEAGNIQDTKKIPNGGNSKV